ncbi:MAG: thioredoxin family protein, partial [Vicinamibacterales bacterium]
MNARSSKPLGRAPRAGPLRGVLTAALAVVFAGVVVWLSVPAQVGGDGSEDIRVLTGGIHTVRHSLRPLPSPHSPRLDGLPTLVQFGATWCEVCHVMEPVMAHVRRSTEGRLAVVEKDLDSEMALARQFRVFGTPTF